MTLVLATLSTLASLHLVGWADKIAATDLPPSVPGLLTLASTDPATTDLGPRKPLPGDAAQLTGTTPPSIAEAEAIKPVPKPGS